jgi:hypothetical protein
MIRLKRFLGILGAVGFGILLAIILLEVIGRVLHLVPVPLSESYQSVREVTGRYPEPYSYFWFDREDGERIWIQFNNASLRDINHDYTIDEAATRIMFLGDSYTAGWQVPLSETYTGRLQDWLANTDEYDFINAGLHGWGTDRQYLYYQTEGHRYNSDVVVLQIYVGNDIIDNGVAVLQQRELPDGRVIPRANFEGDRSYFTLDSNGELLFTLPHWLPTTRIERVSGLRSFLRYYSFTFNLLEQLVQSVVSEQQNPAADDEFVSVFDRALPMDYYAFSPASLTDEDWGAAWQITQQLIRQLRAEVEANGATLMILLVDTRWQHDPTGFEELRATWNIPTDWQPDRWGNRIRDFLESENIPYLAPVDALLAYHETTGAPIIFEKDGHWTAQGQCVVAVQLHNWFIEQGIINSSINPRDELTECLP